MSKKQRLAYIFSF